MGIYLKYEWNTGYSLPVSSNMAGKTPNYMNIIQVGKSSYYREGSSASHAWMPEGNYVVFFGGNTSVQTIFCRTNLTIFCGLGGWTRVKPQYTKFTSCFQGWTLPISIFALWCYALVGQDYTVVTCWEILKNWGWFLGIYTTKYQQPLKDRNGGKTRSKDKSHYMSCIYIMYKYIYMYVYLHVYIYCEFGTGSTAAHRFSK